MPFDPAYPPTNAPLASAEMRAQLTSLKDLIDAVSGVTSAQVDAVNTLPAGSPASVAVSVSSGVLHLSFDLPQESDGTPGQNGSDGNDGGPGPEGPPFTNFIVDGVMTLNPADPATVQASFDGSSANSNGVTTLSFGANPSYDSAQQQEIIAKINELISALRR
ncbi:MAG: hypothetical protein JNM65_16730 [Verrucomicrobiaceae bacterium]|nr:hypothetical protein [Verrucomicrobiaceae bacterium]